jgi:hypothetical protein
VTVALDHPVTGLADQVRNILPNALIIRPRLPGAIEPSEHSGERSLTPEEQFRTWFERANGVAPPASLLKLFRQLRDEAIHATG